jgi:hypothetical protein
MTMIAPLTGPRPALPLLASLTLLAMSGCAGQEARLDVEGARASAQQEKAAPPAKLAHEEADKRLSALGVQYRRVADIDNERGCSIQDGMEVTQIGAVKLTRPALLTQEMALRMGRWVNEVLQPAAERTFGTHLAALDVGGSYSCRNIYGRPFGGRFAGRLSEHAFANAIDIGGFTLTDGRTIKYINHWRAKDGSREFLQSSSLAACEIFNTTLTPDYDRFHRNHIHIDASPRKEDTNKFCGMRGRFSPGAVPAFARYKKATGKKAKPTKKVYQRQGG